MKKILLSISLLSINLLSYGTSLSSMSDKQMKQIFINKTFTSIATDNLNGRTIDNTFSMFLDDQGNIIGKMSIKPENEPQIDRGTYSINRKGSMYITWQHWDGKKQLCANYYNTQNAIIAVSCDGIFHTVFMKNDIKSGNQIPLDK